MAGKPCLLLSACLGLFLGALRSCPAAKPNIILVLIDDMGWSDLSCFGGNRVKTQNIDRLAAEGIRFNRFYVNSPICSPSRTALTTGQYPQRWRIAPRPLRRRQHRLPGKPPGA